MTKKHNHSNLPLCGCCMSKARSKITRRQFIAGAGAAGTLAMASWLNAENSSYTKGLKPTPALPLKVQPVLTCGLYERKNQTSWRPWGGFHTQNDIENEKKRIAAELKKIASNAEFQIEFLPLVTLNDTEKAAKLAQGNHDVLLMYAANSWLDVLEALTNPKKHTIVFVRHKSGPVYLWYEIVHNRYLRKTVDQYGQPGVDHQDVVVDSLDEILWRLSALYGLKNTIGKKIVAVGGAGGWGAGGAKAPEIARDCWKMDIQNIEYDTLAQMIKKARQDTGLIKHCKQQTKKYLNQKNIALEVKPEFVQNAFVLTEVFKNLMDRAQTDAITIQNCMGTIMPLAETTACLPLSILNDSGYTAYCESDFVVIPSGILLRYISSLPVFLNDPTYPHDGIVTLAHCTAPTKMDGKNYEPTTILSHFESDYGAAPKVNMKLGQKITVIDPDFDNKRWLGFEAEIIDNPFLDICRSQIDVKINGDCDTLNAETRGFHWMASYGSYLKEVGYALKKVGIDWLDLSKKT